MMNTMNVNGNRIAYEDLGSGPTIILVHCSSASHKQWASLIDTLQQGFRVLAPDLPGYGRSERWTRHRHYDALDDVAVITRLINMSDEPVHIIAHSYGAAMALEAARMNTGRIRSLVLIEPVSFHLLRYDERFVEWLQICSLTRKVMQATGDGHPEKAAKIFMSFWIGHIRWLFMPRKMKRYIVSTICKVSAECAAINNEHAGLSGYRKINAPTRLIVGSRTKRPARAVIEILGDLLTNAHILELAGAGHMSPITHRDQINAHAIAHIMSPYTNYEEAGSIAAPCTHHCRNDNHPVPVCQQR